MKLVAGGRGRRREESAFLQLSLFEFKREEHGNIDPRALPKTTQFETEV